MIIGTKAEFEQLADFILRDYLGNTYDGYDPLDIQAFAKDYLKLDISYFAFDPDTRIEGMRTGNQIILDDRLLDDKKAGERNFTIARSNQLAGSVLFSANGCELPHQKFRQKPCDGR